MDLSMLRLQTEATKSPSTAASPIKWRSLGEIGQGRFMSLIHLFNDAHAGAQGKKLALLMHVLH